MLNLDHLARIVSDPTQLSDSHVFYIDAGYIAIPLTNENVLASDLQKATGMTVGAKSFEFNEVFCSDYIDFLLHASDEDQIIVLVSTCCIIKSVNLAHFVEFWRGWDQCAIVGGSVLNITHFVDVNLLFGHTEQHDGVVVQSNDLRIEVLVLNFG